MSLLTSLVSYWKLDEASGNRADSQGSNTLTDTNGVSSATGKIGNAASFNVASSQNLGIADNTDLSTGDIDFTFSLWVKFTTTSQYQFILSKDNTTTQREYGFYFDVGVTKIAFYVFDSGGTIKQLNLTTLGTPANGTWYHLVGWHDSVNNIVGAVANGGAADTVSYSNGVKDSTAAFRIGANEGGSFYLNGLVDEVGFWKRVLTSQERTDLYNGGAGLPFSSFSGTTDIAFDAASNSGYQAAASTYSWSHTCTGSNRFLAVDVSLLSAGSTVTGITYNGVALSFIGAQSTVTSFGRVECWGLVAPASGTNTIAVTLSGSIASAGTAVSYTGVNQSLPTEAFNSAQATNVGAADATVTVTTVADNDWVHAAIATSDAAITAGQTSRNNVTGAGGSAADEDTGPVTPAGGQAMTYTGVGALATWAIGGYGIRPTSASGLVGNLPWYVPTRVVYEYID